MMSSGYNHASIYQNNIENDSKIMWSVKLLHNLLCDTKLNQNRIFNYKEEIAILFNLICFFKKLCKALILGILRNILFLIITSCYVN